MSERIVRISQDHVSEPQESQVDRSKTVTPCEGCHIMLMGPTLCAKAIKDTLPTEGNRSEKLSTDQENSRLEQFWSDAALACRAIVASGGRRPVHQIIEGKYNRAQ